MKTTILKLTNIHENELVFTQRVKKINLKSEIKIQLLNAIKDFSDYENIYYILLNNITDCVSSKILNYNQKGLEIILETINQYGIDAMVTELINRKALGVPDAELLALNKLSEIFNYLHVLDDLYLNLPSINYDFVAEEFEKAKTKSFEEFIETLIDYLDELKIVKFLNHTPKEFKALQKLVLERKDFVVNELSTIENREKFQTWKS